MSQVGLCKRDFVLQFKFQKMTEFHARQASQARTLSRDFGLFSKMDIAFWELFFRNIVHGPTMIAYVAVDQTNDKLAGYIIGTTDSSKMSRRLLQDLFLALLWYGVNMLILHPSQIKLVLNKDRKSTLLNSRHDQNS